MLFGQTAFSVEVLLQKLEIGLCPVSGRDNLVFCRGAEGGCLDIWEVVQSASARELRDTGCLPCNMREAEPNTRCRVFCICAHLPLQTRSCVLTCVPSSMVCRVKSISGTCFLFCTARIALSRYAFWSTPCPSILLAVLSQDVEYCSSQRDFRRPLKNLDLNVARDLCGGSRACTWGGRGRAGSEGKTVKLQAIS